MALSKERLTSRKGTEARIARLDLPVKANTKIFAGALVVIDAGYAAPGRTATGLKAIGVAVATADNTGGAAGDIRVEVHRGSHWFKNSTSGDLIAQAEVGTTIYIVDDEQVAKTNGGSTRSVAGVALEVDSSLGVLVEFPY